LYFQIKSSAKLSRKNAQKEQKQIKNVPFVARKSRPRLARVDGFGELLGLASEPTEPP